MSKLKKSLLAWVGVLGTLFYLEVCLQIWCDNEYYLQECLEKRDAVACYSSHALSVAFAAWPVMLLTLLVIAVVARMGKDSNDSK